MGLPVLSYDFDIPVYGYHGPVTLMIHTGVVQKPSRARGGGYSGTFVQPAYLRFTVP
jgi:hypothetical protein